MTDARTNQVITRTAVAISEALDKMVADLPQMAAPQMALEASSANWRSCNRGCCAL